MLCRQLAAAALITPVGRDLKMQTTKEATSLCSSMTGHTAHTVPLEAQEGQAVAAEYQPLQADL